MDSDKLLTSVFEKDGNLPKPPRGYLKTSATGFVLDQNWIKEKLARNISSSDRQQDANKPMTPKANKTERPSYYEPESREEREFWGL